MNSSKRQRLIHSLTELDQGPGIEIAPLHRPLMEKSAWDVSYVDILPADQLVEHYREHSVPVDEIVEVDFPLTGPDGVIRTLSQVAKEKAPLSWVVASHVIEHVPDLIAWLADIADLLRDGGALVLAVPDTRFSFDAYRPQTTVGQMLQAHHDKDVVPSVRAVYDYLRSASSISPSDAWSGHGPGLEGSRYHDVSAVMHEVKRAEAGEYVDSHVWTFRPQTFIEQINELGLLGLCEFTVEKVRTTRPDQVEFYAVLRRLPRDRTPELDAQLRAAGKKKTNDDPARFQKAAPGPQVMAVSDREQRLIERKRALVAKARGVVRRGR